MKLDVTQSRGQVSYGNLIDIVDVIPIEKTSSNINSKSVIEEFIQAGNQLKILRFQYSCINYKLQHLNQNSDIQVDRL